MINSLNIIYEDDQIIVCHKPAGIPVQTNSLTTKDMVSLIKNYISEHTKIKGEPYLGLIQRLDQPVEGLMVAAKTPFAAKKLTEQLNNDKMQKYYYAIVHGVVEPKSGKLKNYLMKDTKSNKALIVDKNISNAKSAILEYTVIDYRGNTTLLNIHLITGRYHQIRAQLAKFDHPIVGDMKYGFNKNDDISAGFPALCSHKIVFLHPKTNKKLEFCVSPEGNSFYKLWSKSTYLDGKIPQD